MRIAALLCLCVLSAKAQTITHGGTYTTSSPFSIQTTEPVVMDHCTWSLSDGQFLITAACQGADVTIQNSTFTSACSNPAIGQLLWPPNIWTWKSFVVRNCFFDGNGQSGCYLSGDYNTTNAVIRVYGNIFENCRCALGISEVRNDPNIYWGWNQIVSGPTNQWNDQISVYESCGLPGSEIILDHNYVQVDPNSPVYHLAGGISAGDSGSSYVIAVGNVLVNCPCGLWAPNGNTSKLLRNTVVGQGPKQVYSTGLMVFAGAGYAIGNSVAWFDPYSNQIHDYYFGAGVGQVANSDADTSLTYNPAQAMYWLWQSELLAAHQTVGPQ